MKLRAPFGHVWWLVLSTRQVRTEPGLFAKLREAGGRCHPGSRICGVPGPGGQAGLLRVRDLSRRR